MSETNLEMKLINAGYAGLFLQGDMSLADTIWQKGKIKTKLEQIIFSESASGYGKFLAAEMLRKYKVGFKEADVPVLARVYSDMLKNTGVKAGKEVRLTANLWGFLYEMDDPGYLGRQLISFGNAAVPYLKELLEDEDPVLYEGSQEATLGNQYQYRIKDFAAFYLSKIMNIPVKFYQEIDKRDKETERLKEKINR